MQLLQTLITTIGWTYLVLLYGSQSAESSPSSEKHPEMRLISKFNRSMCTPESLDGSPIRLIFQSRGNRVPIGKPYILSSFDLKKYEYIDTEYVESELQEADSLVLQNFQTPRDIFEEQRLSVENYMILSEKDFRLTLVNPTSTFRICLHRVFVDSPEVELREDRRTPYCLDPLTKYPLEFSVYMHEPRANRFLRTAIFLEVQLNDTKTGQLVQRKIWTKEVVVSIHNNWLNLAKVQYEQGFEDYTYVDLENSFDETLQIELSSSLLMRFEDDPKQEQNKLSLMLGPKQRVVVEVEAKKGQLLVIGQIQGMKLDTLRVPVGPRPFFTIDPINAGVITNKKHSVELLLTVTNTYNASIFIQEIELNSKLKTAVLRRIDNLTNEVKSMVAFSPVALIRIYSSLKDDVIPKCQVRVRFWLSSAPAGTSLDVQAEFHYAEIHSPLNGLQKRFIYVDSDQGGQVKKVEDTLFPAKNSLNLPLKLTRVIIDETKFKISWLSDTRDYIYPNQQSYLFGLEHLQASAPFESPVTVELMLLEFNHNLLIPVELVLYDKKLQCSFGNLTGRCAKMGYIDVGYVRSGVQSVREVRIKNTNPTAVDVNVSLLKSNGEVKMAIVYSEERDQPMEGRLVRAHLKPRSFIIIRLTIKCMHSTVFTLPEVKFRTAEELFMIKFVYKMSQGTLTIFPNPLVLTDTIQPITNFLYIQSTLSESYSFFSIVPNDTDITVYYDPKILVPIHEVKALPVLYQTSNIRSDCFQDENMLEDMRYVTTSYGRALKTIEVKILTSNDFQLSAIIHITKQNIRLINQSVAQFNVIESTNNNYYSVDLVNPHHSPISIKPVFVDAALPHVWAETKARLDHLLTRSDFYFCMSETAKDRLKLTIQSIKSLFRLEQNPVDFFIDTLENNSFYLHWLRKVEMKQHNQLSEEMSQEMVNIILSGARYCYKGEAPIYFQQLVVSDVFNAVIEHAPPEMFQEFVERECNHLLKPSFVKKYDTFYSDVFRYVHPDVKLRYLTGSNLPCIFKYCHYTPIGLGTTNMHTLQPNETLRLTMSLMQTNISLRVSLLVFSNITTPQECAVLFHMTRMLLRVEGLLLYGIYFSKDEFVKHYLSEAKFDLTKTLPVYLNLQEVSQGLFAGQRTFVLKNHGISTISINRIVFQETMSCEHPYYDIQNCSAFDIPSKQSYNLTVLLKLGIRNVGKTVKVVLFCDKFFYKLELVSMLGESPKSMNLTASEQELYLYLAITLASIAFIYKLLRLIKEEDVRQSKVRTIFDKATHNPIPHRSRHKPIQLPEEFLLRFAQERRSKVGQQNQPRDDSKKMNDSQSNDNQVNSQPSASKDQLSDDRKSYDRSEVSVGDIEEEKNQTFESNSSLSSGSSLSQGFLDQIDEYAMGKYDRSNSDVNEGDSRREDGGKQGFYDVFKSEGPLTKKNSDDIKQQEDEGHWLQELTRVSTRERGHSHSSFKKEPRA